MNLDLLVEEGQFLVTLDELSAENISLVDDHLVVFLLFEFFALSF